MDARQVEKEKNRTLRLAGFLFGFCFERERVGFLLQSRVALSKYHVN